MLRFVKNIPKNSQFQVDRFADGEVNVMVKENVRGKDVYIIQPTCMPVNENLVELLLMVRNQPCCVYCCR